MPLFLRLSSVIVIYCSSRLAALTLPSSLLSADLQVSELQNSAYNFASEMRSVYGIDIKSLVRDKKKELHYAEFGLGGGGTVDGGKAARSAYEVRF